MYNSYSYMLKNVPGLNIDSPIKLILSFKETRSTISSKNVADQQSVMDITFPVKLMGKKDVQLSPGMYNRKRPQLCLYV